MGFECNIEAAAKIHLGETELLPSSLAVAPSTVAVAAAVVGGILAASAAGVAYVTPTTADP